MSGLSQAYSMQREREGVIQQLRSEYAQKMDALRQELEAEQKSKVEKRTTIARLEGQYQAAEARAKSISTDLEASQEMVQRLQAQLRDERAQHELEVSELMNEASDSVGLARRNSELQNAVDEVLSL